MSQCQVPSLGFPSQIQELGAVCPSVFLSSLAFHCLAEGRPVRERSAWPPLRSTKALHLQVEASTAARVRAVCAGASRLLPQPSMGWEWTKQSPCLARAGGQRGSFFSFHAAEEAPEGEGSGWQKLGRRGTRAATGLRALLTSSPGCFLIQSYFSACFCPQEHEEHPYLVVSM